MYSVGQMIVYGASGVCRVEAVEPQKNAPAGMKDRLYYRLKPLYDQGVVYTPVETTVAMRPLLTRDEADALIRAIPDIAPAPCESRSPQLLGEHYKSFFVSHRAEDLLRLIKTVYLKMKIGGPRALGKTDQHYLKRAEDLLYKEFAAALELPVDGVKPYIEQTLGGFDALQA